MSVVNHQDNFGTNPSSSIAAGATTSPLDSIPSVAAPFYLAFDATNVNGHFEIREITSKTATNVNHSALTYAHSVEEEVRLVVPAIEFDQFVTLTGTETLTNKTISSSRVNERTNTVASSGTPSINTDTTDIFTITALAAAITSMTTNLSGTPVNGQKLIIRIKDDGTARAITWGASFASRGATLPTTTTVNKYLYVGFIYNSTASVWDCVAVSTEA